MPLATYLKNAMKKGTKLEECEIEFLMTNPLSMSLPSNRIPYDKFNPSPTRIPFELAHKNTFLFGFEFSSPHRPKYDLVPSPNPVVPYSEGPNYIHQCQNYIIMQESKAHNTSIWALTWVWILVF